MRRVLLLLAGLATGYVIGARAGRPAYEAVVGGVRTATRSAPAREVGRTVRDAVEERAPRAAAVAEAAAQTVGAAARSASDVPPEPEPSAGSEDAASDEPRGVDREAAEQPQTASESADAEAGTATDDQADAGTAPTATDDQADAGTSGTTADDQPDTGTTPPVSGGDGEGDDAVVFSEGDFPAPGLDPEEVAALRTFEETLEGGTPTAAADAPATPDSPRGDTAPVEPGSDAAAAPTRRRTRRASTASTPAPSGTDADPES